ncbi:MAG: hypothetical protein LBL66_08855, partial [Clostridiales bacterium]|nr:hypothetical protein [Clostridiales bacterium]
SAVSTAWSAFSAWLTIAEISFSISIMGKVYHILFIYATKVKLNAQKDAFRVLQRLPRRASRSSQ